MSDFPDKRIIKDEIKIPEQTVPRVLTRDFLGTSRRKSFVSANDPPNERRFDPAEKVLNNTFNSKTKRI